MLVQAGIVTHMALTDHFPTTPKANASKVPSICSRMSTAFTAFFETPPTPKQRSEPLPELKFSEAHAAMIAHGPLNPGRVNKSNSK